MNKPLINDLGAIDARFIANDQKFTNTDHSIGKLEGRVEKLEEARENHSNGFSKHGYAIDNLNVAVTGLSGSLIKVDTTLEEFKTAKNKVLGAIWLFKFVLTPTGVGAGVVYMIGQIVGLIK